jgi:hypothetical protein
VLRHRGELAAIIGQLARRTPEKMDAPVRIALEMGIYPLRFPRCRRTQLTRGNLACGVAARRTCHEPGGIDIEA